MKEFGVQNWERGFWDEVVRYGTQFKPVDYLEQFLTQSKYWVEEERAQLNSLLAHVLVARNMNSRLLSEHVGNGDFKKAATIYSNLLETISPPRSDIIKGRITCHLYLQDEPASLLSLFERTGVLEFGASGMNIELFEVHSVKLALSVLMDIALEPESSLVYLCESLAPELVCEIGTIDCAVFTASFDSGTKLSRDYTKRLTELIRNLPHLPREIVSAIERVTHE